VEANALTEETTQSRRGPDRRALLRNGLLAGAAATVATIALPGITGSAQAAVVEADAFGPLGIDIAFSAQTQWWWCTNCSGLFYSASGAPAGSCPFNGYHQPGSWMYETPVLTSGDAGAEQEQAQHGWLWCNWCTGLFFGPNWPSSHCPGNVISFAPNTTGPHNSNAGSDPYLLPYSGSDGGWSQGAPSLQAGWLWCKNCQGLFHSNSGTSAGLCPELKVKGPHNGSGSYQTYYLFVGHQ
jgi:hypothetical protein